MMVSTLLVILMIVPGVALFYGGLVRTKNMLSVLTQVMAIFSLISVLWAIYGYSLAFAEGNQFVGGFDRLFLKGIWDNAAGTCQRSDLHRGRGDSRDHLCRLPGDLRCHHLALIVGALAERMKFSALLAVHGAVVHLLPICRSRTWCGSGWVRRLHGKEVV